MDPQSALAIQKPGQTVDRLREATDVASVCKKIAEDTAVTIGNRKYVIVEAWTSIAVAHGCIATIKEGSVQEVLRSDKLVGVKAVAEIRRQLDGAILSSAEGFVGADEETWFGSNGEKVKRWSRALNKEIDVVIPKREDYAIRSMAQTRAISRACRTAFSHVVVMMNAGLSTVPYEEVSDPERDAIDVAATTVKKDEKLAERRADPVADAKAPPQGEKKADPPANPTAEKKAPAPKAAPPAASPQVPRDPDVAFEQQFADGKWKEVKVHFGTNQGIKLGDLKEGSLVWYCFTWAGKGKNAAGPTDDDRILRAACNRAIAELGLNPPPERG